MTERVIRKGLSCFEHRDYEQNFFIQVAFPADSKTHRARALKRFREDLNRHEANFKINPDFYITPKE